MTDYEEEFISWRELEGIPPITNQSALSPLQKEPWPQSDMPAGWENIEDEPIYSTSVKQQELMEPYISPPEEDEEDYYGKEAADDEYGDEYGEEGEEGGEEDYGEDYGEEAEASWPPKEQIAPAVLEDRFFQAGESLRGKYSDVELDAFMKLLNVKPHKQWQDQNTHHYKLGVHNYEDQNQELDPDFHVLSEEERKYADREMTRKWRKGSEVKFVLDGREPITPKYRF